MAKLFPARAFRVFLRLDEIHDRRGIKPPSALNGDYDLSSAPRLSDRCTRLGQPGVEHGDEACDRGLQLASVFIRERNESLGSETYPEELIYRKTSSSYLLAKFEKGENAKQREENCGSIDPAHFEDPGLNRVQYAID